MPSDLFAEDFKAAPYWWDAVPRPGLAPADPPVLAEVVIVGSGYTGLQAALQTARGGRHTVVLDAEAAGFGCSTRNGGQISTSVKPGFDELARRHGRERAFAIMQEGRNSLRYIGDFVRDEQIDCDFGVVGRFHAAHAPGKYEELARSIGSQPKGLEVACHVVPRAEQRSEIGSDLYHGGVVYESHASINPARYHQGLLQRAADHIVEQDEGFDQDLARGAVDGATHRGEIGFAVFQQRVAVAAAPTQGNVRHSAISAAIGTWSDRRDHTREASGTGRQSRTLRT